MQKHAIKKMELHNILQCRLRTEPQVTCMHKKAQYGNVLLVIHVCEQTDRQTDILIIILDSPPIAKY